MTKIAIVGGGNMGYALAASCVDQHPNIAVTVADPVKTQLERFASLPIQATSNNQAAIQGADLILLAVKPQVLQDVASQISPAIGDSLIVSIAAGVPLSKLQLWFGPSSPIVRCMPNTPILVDEGMFGLLANAQVTLAQRKLIEAIFGSVGKTMWFTSDRELDVVTAVSGSGPAYYFYLTEALVEGAKELGLNAQQAHELAVQTSMGAGRMLRASEDSPAQLRENVTSPGGTTAAALEVLDGQAVSESIQRAVVAAFQRARELAK